MNLYYENYAEAKISGISKKEWEDFGYDSMVKLFLFLGVKTNQDLNQLVRHFRYEEHPMGAFLLKENQFPIKIFYIVSGTIRLYSMVNGVEITKSLLAAGNMVSSIKFISGEPSEIYIQACSKCRVLTIEAQDLLQLMQNGWAMELMMVNQTLFSKGISLSSRISDIRQMDSTKRIQELSILSSDIFQQFSAKHIAGLLGMTPSTYSKLKAKSI